MNNQDIYYDFKKPIKIKNNNNNNNINKNDKINTTYTHKFKIALLCFLLFIILSNKNTYKILEIIIRIFRKDTNDIIDDNCNPHILGLGIMGLIFSIIILIFN